jgi:hypothetical protein
MTRLDDYRSALLASFHGVSNAELDRALGAGGPRFVSFIIDHGLGPLWHVRTGRAEFAASRISAEVHYLAQEHALVEIDAALSNAGIEHVVVKGVANRLLLYENPAVRTCHDIDLLVHSKNRLRAAKELIAHGFSASALAHNISHELLLSRDIVDIDLHWGLLRDGRLRTECAAEMLQRRRRSADTWMLSAEDTFFMLLVHPAFTKHLAGREMGLHRVVDIVDWVRSQSFDWPCVCAALQRNGVRSAAWATLRWVQLLTSSHAPAELDAMLADTQPGRLRRAWLDYWLRNDLSTRMTGARWTRLLGLSVFLHDTPGDAMHALCGWQRDRRRRAKDLMAFSELYG